MAFGKGGCQDHLSGSLTIASLPGRRSDGRAPWIRRNVMSPAPVERLHQLGLTVTPTIYDRISAGGEQGDPRTFDHPPRQSRAKSEAWADTECSHADVPTRAIQMNPICCIRSNDSITLE